MRYLAQHVTLRENPARILDGARSVICAAASYNQPQPQAPPSTPKDAPRGRVARYVRGRDYHDVLRSRLERLIDGLRAGLPERFEARVVVDTAPLLERELAAAAGLGWIGKNTLLLNERLGSFVLLGEIVTTLELAPDEAQTDHCGNCTRCLDACPTAAFPAPYQMDASRCISYFTIEHRGPVPDEFHEAIGDWIYGCDVCQEVCPFNTDAEAGTDAALLHGGLPAQVELRGVEQLTPATYRELVAGTAADRARLDMWQRNARIASKNATRAAQDGGAKPGGAKPGGAQDPPAARTES